MPTTRPYAACLAQALALCGIPDSNPVEVARMGIFLNRRAKQAYAESELWPRWLVVGEERVVSEDGLLPYSQDGLRDIGTIYRIHEAEPFKTDPAGEYIDWNSQSDGVQITGYVPVIASIPGDLTIVGNLNPDLTGTYPYAGQYNDAPSWTITGGAIPLPFGQGVVYYTGDDGGPNSSRWYLTNNNDAIFLADGGTSETPVDLDWQADIGTGTPVFSIETLYSAYITYKAAFSTTYGTGDGEQSEVPEEWFEWMATGAAADFLCSDKDTENGLLLKGEAQTDLEQQLAKISRQNGSKAATRVLTHGGMQAR